MDSTAREVEDLKARLAVQFAPAAAADVEALRLEVRACNGLERWGFDLCMPGGLCGRINERLGLSVTRNKCGTRGSAWLLYQCLWSSGWR